MNAFATLCHLLRTDLRRFRFYIISFILLNAAAVVLVERVALTRWLGESLVFIFLMGQITGLVLLVAQVFLADSAAHSRSQWWTRPIGIGTLLASKILYVVVALWLPILAAYVTAWVYDGLTTRQFALAFGELTLYLFAVSAFTAGIAAAASHFWKFAAQLGLTAAAAILFLWLGNATHWRVDVIDKIGWVVSGGMFTTLTLLGFLGAGTICLVAVYGFRRRRLAWLGLAIAVLMPLWMPGYEDDPTMVSRSHQQIVLVSPASGEPRDGTLFRNIALRGLPENHFAVPIEAEFNFTDGNRNEAHFKLMKQFVHHGIERELEQFTRPFVRSALPQTVRFQAQSGYESYARRTIVSASQDLESESPGRLAGELTYLLYETVYAGELPLRRGAGLTHQGHRLRLLDFGESDNTIDFELQTSAPRLIWSAELDDGSSGDPGQPWSTWLLVTVYPESGYAVASQSRSRSILGGTFPITLRCYERASFDRPGFRSDQDAPPQLHAFRIVAKGVYQQTFDWSDHLVETKMRASFDAVATVDDIDFQDDSAARSVDTLESVDDLKRFRIDLRGQEWSDLKARAAEIFASDIPGALAGVPWRRPTDQALEETLTRHLTDAHLIHFREALARDSRLIEVVKNKEWGDRFVDYVTAEMARRYPSASYSLLRLAATYRDPALYDDLRWHFIHGRWIQRERLYPRLESLPEFDARQVLEAAWERSRFNGNRGDLLNLALKHGLPGALDYAVSRLYAEGIAERESASSLFRTLRGVTNHTGPWQDFYPWITENAGKLVFDPETQSYRLEN